MPDLFGDISMNARTGREACEGCPAHEAGNGRLVSPGAGDRDAEVMFLTDEPRHEVDWGRFITWRDYNEWFMGWFPSARGGAFLEMLLEPFDIGIEDVWIGDSLKCPTEPNEDLGAVDVERAGAFDHCRSYLAREIEAVDPAVVVPLGRRPARRVHRVLGIPASDADTIRITEDYGRSRFETDPPVVNCLHWAQMSLPYDEFVPDVQKSMRGVIG